MSDESLPIIPHAGSSLAQIGPQGGRIVAEMVSGALALSRNNAAQVPRFTIGEHVFCEPDYQQILRWAEALKMDAVEVIICLLDQSSAQQMCGSIPFFHTRNETVFLNGRIVKLNWNLDLLPIQSFDWVDGLVIEWLWFRFSDSQQHRTEENRRERPRLEISPKLPRLRFLHCSNVRIESLDLSHPRQLNVLILDNHGFTNLCIPHLPQLETLWCSETDMVQLDVSNVPMLQELWIWESEISSLDLTQVPKLREFYMMFGDITELDVSKVRHLEKFCCFNCRLETLSFTNHPKLASLQCINNCLRTLSIPGASQLKTLWCENNQLTAIDLSSATQLEVFHCDRNQIALLEISSLEHLKDLRYDKDTTRLIQRPDQNF